MKTAVPAITLIYLFASSLVLSAESERESTRSFLSIVEDKELSYDSKLIRLRESLRKLSRDEFMDVIRESRKLTGYKEVMVDGGYAMFMASLLGFYLEGPGKDEQWMLTLKQVSDLSLPSGWRFVLLDMTRGDKYKKLSQEEQEAVWRLLLDAANTPANTEQFRLICLDKLSRYLRDRRDLRFKTSPFLMTALLRRDRKSLSLAQRGSPTDLEIQAALKWLDVVDEYEFTARKQLKEFKDEQNKAHLMKRLEGLAPMSITQEH